MRPVTFAAVLAMAIATSACESHSTSTATGGPGATRTPATPQASPSSTASATVSNPLLVLGPEGVGPLRLGMTVREVKATGAASASVSSSAAGIEEGWVPGCGPIFYNARVLGSSGYLNGIVSARLGIEQLNATTRMVTPQGIHLGSSLDEVRKAFRRPGARDGDQVVLKASKDSVYVIQVEHVVTDISLQRRRVTCQP